jgi:tetratricopeptide (TPR) repeat protein
LTTIADRLRRPGPPLGLVVAGLLGLALVVFLIALWLRPGAYVPKPGAQAMYDQGTEALRSGSFLQATKALEEAVRIDDKFAMAHAHLAEAWYELDYADKAKDEMLKAQPVGGAPSTLPRLDTLYLVAIHATVTQDFPGAVKVYKEIALFSPDDAYVHLDLGRAYEKNDQLREAAESYRRAGELAPQQATAFLRLAVMNGKQIDLPSAFTNFDRADTLYQASGNYEGQAEVAYQRGFLLNQSEKFPEARQQLERALELARTTHSEYEEVKSLLKLGEVIVAQGQADEGRRYMQQAIDLAQASGIENYIKRGLIDLGNTFMLSREYPKAEEYFKQSLELSQRQKDLRNVARALLSLASVSERQNNLDQAVAYALQALPFYQLGGYRREMIQAVAVLARAKRKKGEYEAALKAFEEELKLAQTLGDQALIAQSNVDIGVVLMNQAHYPEALQHFEEGYAVAKRSSYQQNIGLYLTNRANALWNLGRYSEADPLLNEVSSMAAQPEGKGFANWYHVSAARQALTRRQFEDAQRSAEQAMTFNALPPLVETSLVGVAQVRTAASRAGRLKCEAAIALLTPTTDPLIAAEVKLGFAEALLQTGDAAAALKTAVEAKETFARLGKPDSEWLALLIAARAGNNGNAAKAREYASQAETVLAGLAQRWGNDNFQSYLNRPDVKFNRNQLKEILEQKP